MKNDQYHLLVEEGGCQRTKQASVRMAGRPIPEGHLFLIWLFVEWSANFMEATFCFSKDLQIIFYGINSCSEQLYKSLTDAGYDVVAFFDRRYETLKDQYSIPVYGLKDHPFVYLDKTNYCVVIMLQNAMQHEPIAMELLQQGFHKIIFIPMESHLNEEIAQILRHQYNRLMSGQFQMLCKIPLLHENILQPEINPKYAIVQDGEVFQIVWCPAELLYSNSSRLCKRPSRRQYANIPLYSCLLYVNFFEYLQGAGVDSRQYLDEYGVHSCNFPTSLTDAGVIAQRKALLDVYKNALNKGMDFFISSAPPAEWNARYKVFNLMDGQHRSLFLLMQEFRYIPIRISRDDYRAWACACESTNLKAYLESGRERPHILHPQYHKINESADRGDLLQLESIQRYLSDRPNLSRTLLEGKTVLDLSGTFGYYARNSLRMRAARADLYAPEGVEAAHDIHALEGFSDIPAVDLWEAAVEPYHCLFVLNALAGLPEAERPRWMDRCAELCMEECYVSVRDSAELEQWRRRFHELRELRTLFNRGQLVHLCVLRK